MNAPTMFMGVPVKRMGQVVGVVWGQLDLKRVWDILEKIKPGPLSRAYVLDRAGKTMSQEGVVQLNAPTMPEPAKGQQWAGDERVHSWEITFEGDNYLISGMEIPEIGWNLLLFRPYREVYQFFYRSIRISAVLMALIAVAIFVVTWLYAKRFVRPIQTLRDGAIRLASGDLLHRITVSSRDELGQLCNAFNQMAEDLKRYLQRLVRKTEEEAHQKNLSLLGTTAGKVAHQVGNFLNTMSFGLSNLKMNDLDAGSNKNIEVMERNIESFKDFIRGYLAFAKRPRLDVAPADLKKELELLAGTYPAGRFSINLQCGPSVHGHFLLECDVAQLRQAFLCIIDNAREAQNGAGSMDIIIEDMMEHMLLTFKDYGPGLQPEDAEHIFELFFTTKGKGGTGLGLAIAKSIIDAHFGSIVARSIPGEGTSFIIELPKKFGA
jgi:signal transduction histidine kinase